MSDSNTSIDLPLSSDPYEILRRRLLVLMEIGQQIFSSAFETGEAPGWLIMLTLALPTLQESVKSAPKKQLVEFTTSYAPMLRDLCAVDFLTSKFWDWLGEGIEKLQDGADIKTLWPPPADVFLPEWRDLVSADIERWKVQQAVSSGETPPTS